MKFNIIRYTIIKFPVDKIRKTYINDFKLVFSYRKYEPKLVIKLIKALKH